jgi:glycosyltransferase involved in cell wall biosynthesis
VNVLVLAHSYPRFATDPVGSFVLRLAVAVRPAGVDVRVVAPGGEGLAARETYEGVVVERFRYAPRRYETLAYTGTMRDQVLGSWTKRAFMASFVAAETGTALRVARAFKPDLVHAHWWFPAGLVGGWVRRWRGVPLVITLHGSDLRLAQDLAVATRLFRHVLRRATTVTTVSSWLARETEALVPGVRPVVAPMPVVPDLFAPGGARERDRLLFVGKLNPQKGIVHLLRALALMRERPALDVVVGVGGAPDDLQPLVRELNLTDRIHWHPLLEQAELAHLYRSATVLVAPWTDEGLGLVAIEAQLSEMPVVAFRSGGLTDIVEHERTGLLVPVGDAAALAAALDQLLALPDQGAAWGREGRRRAVATFSPAATAQRYADIYRAALDRGRP